MADAPTEAFEKKILLALESTMTGVRDTLLALEAMKKRLGDVTASTKSFDKAYKTTSKTLKDTEKSLTRYTKSLKITKRLQKGLFESMRGIGNITRVSMGAASAAAAGLLFETRRLGQSMLEFKISSLDASQAIETLESSYKNMAKSGGQLRLSIQDVAAVITKFQSKGIAQMALGITKEFQETAIGIGSVLARGLGKGGAADALDSFFNSMASSFGGLTKLMTSELNGLSKEFMRAQAAGNMSASVASLGQMEEAFKNVRIESNDQFIAIQRIINAFRSLKDFAAGGGDEITRSVMAMNDAWSNLGRIIENFSYGIVAKLGPDIARVLDNLSNRVLGDFENTLDDLGIVASRVYDQFKEWGGIDKVVEGINRNINVLGSAITGIARTSGDVLTKFQEWGGIDAILSGIGSTINFLVDALAALIKSSKWVIQQFAEMGSYGKVLTGVFAGMVISPTLFLGLKSVTLGLKDIVKWGLLASRSTVGIGGMLGKGGMVGIGALAAGGGYFAGRAGAQFLGADQGGIADILSGAAGAAGGGALAGAVFGPWGAAIGAAIAGIGSIIISGVEDWGAETKKVVKATADFNKKQIAASEQITQKLPEQVKESAEAMSKLVKEAKKLEDIDISGFMTDLENLKRFVDITLPGFAGSMDSLVSVIGVLGPASAMFGQNIANMIDDLSVGQMAESFDGLKKSAIAVVSIQAEMAKHPEQAAFYTAKLKEALAAAAMASKGLEQSLEAGLQPLKTQLDMVSAIKDLRQLDLDISQQLYGTPALAVKAQLELVKTMQAQKENLEDQLAFTQDRIAQAKALHLSEQDIFFLRMKELALGKEIKSVTRDQLRAVKELRDGYISSVTQMALGAGRFQKILISQEQNLARGLIEGAVKPNFLLGQAGAAASASRADPYRFSAQGMGFLETLSGQIMRPEDIAKAVYDRVANISDPFSKAAALQSADIFTNIISGANKNTRDLGNIFMLGQDRVVDAISGLAEYRLPRAAAGLALKGAPAGETVFGAAMDRLGRGLTLPPPATGVGGLSLDAAYRQQAEKQGSALASIEALLEYRRRGDEAVAISGMPAAPVHQIDPGKANTFFGQALPYYSRFESLLAAIAEGLGVELTTIQNITVAGAKAVPAGFGMSTLSVRGAGQVGLSQAAPGDSQSSKQLVDDLRRSDREVKRHERAHARVAGSFVEGPPNYTYKRGPDGRRYAVGGEVLVDLSPIPGDPQATIDKMQQIREAALAPRRPSEQDLAVAQQASQIERRIKASLPTVLGISPSEGTISEEPRVMKGFRRLKDRTEPIIPDIPEVGESQVLKTFRRVSLGAPPVASIGAGSFALVPDIVERAAKAQQKATTVFEKLAKDRYRIRDIPRNIAKTGKALADGMRTAEKGTRAYNSGQAVRGIPGKAVELGRTAGGKTLETGRAIKSGVGRAVDAARSIRAADVGRGLSHVVRGAQAGGRALGSAGRGIGGTALALPALAGTALYAAYQGKQLEKDMEKLGKTRETQEKKTQEFGAVIRVPASSERDTLIKERQKWEHAIMNLEPEIGTDFFGISDIGEAPGELLKTLQAKRDEANKKIQEFDRNVSQKYIVLTAKLDNVIQKIQQTRLGEDISELQAKFTNLSQETDKFIGELISGVGIEFSSQVLTDIAEASEKIIKEPSKKLLSQMKDVVQLQMDLDADPENKAVEKELGRVSHQARMTADRLRRIGGTESVDKVIDQFSQYMQTMAGQEVVAITKQINSLMQGVSPRNMPDDLKKQVDKLNLERTNIQFDMDIGDKLSQDELDILGPYLKSLKSSIAGYAEVVKKSAVAGPDEKPELEKQLTGMGNNISDQMTKMGRIFGADPGFAHVSKAIIEAQAQATKVFDEQAQGYKQEINKFKTMKAEAPPRFHAEIQSNINDLQAKLNKVPAALNAEFEILRGNASMIVPAAPKVTERVAGKGIAEQAKKYGDVLDHLQSVLGKDIDLGDFNISELKSAQKIVVDIYNTYQKQGAELEKQGKLHVNQKIALRKGYDIVQRLNQAEAKHRAKTEQHDRERQAAIGQQQMVREKIANIKLPLKEAEALRKIEADRAQGVEITSARLKADVPEMIKTVNLRKKALKRDGAKAPEREEGQTREKYRETKRQFRVKRETESQLAVSALKDRYGDDWHRITANIDNMLAAVTGKRTQTPGQLDRGIERLNKTLETKEGELAQLQGKEAVLDAADAFAGMPSAMKDIIRSSTQAISPGQAIAGGGVAGAIEALLSDDKGIENIINKALGGARQAIILKGALGPVGGSSPAKSVREALELDKGSRYKRPAQGISALPGVEMILTAVDTDQFTKPIDIKQQEINQQEIRETREKYGAHAEPMLRRAQDVGKIDERIKKIDRELKGPKADRGGFGTGPKDLLGYEIPGVTEPKEERRRGGVQTPMSVERREKLQARKRALKAVKDNKIAQIEELREKAKKAGGVKQSQGEKDRLKNRLDEQIRKQQAAAEGAFGLGYTGPAPERIKVDETGRPILERKVTLKKPAIPDMKSPVADVPPGVLPKTPQTPPETGPQAPGVVRGRQAPIAKPAGVPDPTRIRQLGHGAGGNWQSKGKGVKQILQQAGQIIEEMGSEMDRFNEDQDNITQYAGNRLFSVQAISP